MLFAKQTWLMLGFLAFILLMLIGRIYLTGNITYIFLLWNIFLAAVPYWLGRFITNNFKNVWNILLTGLWLLFYPNALYIVTDLMHLQNLRTFPIWYDVVLLFSSSVLGLILGFKSLWRMEKIIASVSSKKATTVFIIAIIALSSFGVYLGRFLRWNSWDIVSQSLNLMKSIADRFIHPASHPRTWAVTFTLSVLYFLLYELSKANVVRRQEV